MLILAAIGAYAIIMYLLLMKVKDGLTYTPIVGLGFGYIIGDAIAEQFGVGGNRLGGVLSLTLGILPLALLVWVRWQEKRARARPSDAELAQLEREVDWKPYDPGWLVALARQQQPQDRPLHELLAACTKCVESNDMTCFVNPVLITRFANVRTFLRKSDHEAVLIYYLPWGGIAAIGSGRFPSKPAV